MKKLTFALFVASFALLSCNKPAEETNNPETQEIVALEDTVSLIESDSTMIEEDGELEIIDLSADGEETIEMVEADEEKA